MIVDVYLFYMMWSQHKGRTILGIATHPTHGYRASEFDTWLGGIKLNTTATISLVQLSLHAVVVWHLQTGLYSSKLHVFHMHCMHAWVPTKHVITDCVEGIACNIWIQNLQVFTSCFTAGCLPAELNDLAATMIFFFQEFHQYLSCDSTPIPPSCCQEVLAKLTVISEPSKVW